jgi:fructokinase
MHQKQVFPSIYKHLKNLLNDYVSLPELSDYIVPPGRGDNAGIIGALLLAQQAIEDK